MVLFALLLGIASGIAAYGNAAVDKALSECEVVRDSLQDCMRSKGYVLSKGDRLDAPDNWQREWLHRFLDELYGATPSEDDSAEGLPLY
jgi:hypothetical protein